MSAYDYELSKLSPETRSAISDILEKVGYTKTQADKATNPDTRLHGLGSDIYDLKDTTPVMDASLHLATGMVQQIEQTLLQNIKLQKNTKNPEQVTALEEQLTGKISQLTGKSPDEVRQALHTITEGDSVRLANTKWQPSADELNELHRGERLVTIGELELRDMLMTAIDTDLIKSSKLTPASDPTLSTALSKGR